MRFLSLSLECKQALAKSLSCDALWENGLPAELRLVFHNACKMPIPPSLHQERLPSDEEDLVSSDDGSNSSSVINSGMEAEDLVDKLISRAVEKDIVDVSAAV